MRKCIECGYLDMKPPQWICTKDTHTSVDIVGGDLALEFLYKECPITEEQETEEANEYEEEIKALKKENEQLKQENKRLKEILKIKRKEIITRVIALQEITDKYTNEVLFKNNVNPNEAVKQVLKEILTFKVKEYD